MKVTMNSDLLATGKGFHCSVSSLLDAIRIGNFVAEECGSSGKNYILKTDYSRYRNVLQNIGMAHRRKAESPREFRRRVLMKLEFKAEKLSREMGATEFEDRTGGKAWGRLRGYIRTGDYDSFPDS